MHPPLSLFRRYFLASPGTNAVCTTTLVTRDIDTRVVARAEGKRSTLCRQGDGIADRPSLARIFFFLPFLSLFSLFSFSFFLFSTIRTPLLHPRLPFVLRLLSLVSALQFFFFLFLFLFVLFPVYFVYSKLKGKEE